MARTVPATSYHAPGDLVTASVWNTGPKVMNDFLFNRPAMVALANTNQTVTNNTWTPVNYTRNLLDTDTGHDTASNTQKFFAEVAGWYWVKASISWNSSGVGNGVSRIDAAIAKNGTIVSGSAQFLTKGANVASAQQASTLTFLNPGDRVELWTRQLTGITLNTDFGFGIEIGMNVLWVHS